MPKATFEFNLPEEQEEFEIFNKSGAMHSALWDISQEVFRPNYKHGYPNSQLEKLREDEKVVEAIEILTKMFYDILESQNIQL